MSVLQATIPTTRCVRISQRATRNDVWPECVVTQAALTRLRSSPHRVLQSLTCVFSSGQLHLKGTVPSYYMKQMAQETIRSVEGVEQIVNRVIVT